MWMKMLQISFCQSLLNSTRHEQNCALLGYYAACSGNFLLMFMLHNSPEERSSHVLQERGLKSCIALAKFYARLSGGPDPLILAHQCFTIHQSEDVMQEMDISYTVCGYHYKQ
jgi:hypothetical protein